MEQTDEWTEARRYISLDFLAKARMRLLSGETPDQNPAPQAITLNLQKQDHAEVVLHTPLDVTQEPSPMSAQLTAKIRDSRPPNYAERRPG